MTAEQLLMKAKVQLILAEPFFATLALKMKYIPDETIPTACTNGKYIKYNPKFIESLPLDEVKFIIAHEVMHPAMMHHTRRCGRDPRKWNEAADYAINEILTKSGLPMPNGGLLNPKYYGQSAEHIYSQLPDNPGDGIDPGGFGAVVDATGPNGGKPTQSDISAMEADIKVALAQAKANAKREGKLPGELARLIDEILEPQIPWREVLARFLSETSRNDYTFKKPNPRYVSSGFYLPYLENETTGDIALIVDTSGSIDNELLGHFAGEMQDILSTFDRGFHVIYVDTRVAGTQFIEPDTFPIELEPKGGGGTDFKPGFEYIEQEGLDPKAIVYFTDGYCYSFPEDPGTPVLWATYDNEHFEPPFGEVIYITR